MLPLQQLSVGYHEVPARFGGWDKVTSRGSFWALWDLQEMATGGQRRLSQVFHCKARNKAGEMG